MNNRLSRVKNWEELARRSLWSAKRLAQLCGVSVDTMRRHFISMSGKSTRQWLAEERQRQALSVLAGGASVKETAICLGYSEQTNFTRQFKKHWGKCPSYLLISSNLSAIETFMPEND